MKDLANNGHIATDQRISRTGVTSMRQHHLERLAGRRLWTSLSDVDAAAFLSAASITDATISTAINTLVAGLKVHSLWTPMFAIYPMVGGTASTHKFNLKNPANSDGAFRLSFSGSWTHSSTGALPDGSSAYADTHFNSASSGFTTTSAAMGYYSRTAENGGGSLNRYDFSCSDASDLGDTLVICRYHTDTAYFGVGTNTYAPSAAETDGRGFFVTSRVDGTATSGYKNGTSLCYTMDVVTLKSYSLYLGASNRGGSAAYFGAKECAFAFASSGLSSGDASTLYTLIQAFQTSLGRQV